MAKSYEVGLIIKGDSKGGVQALKATQAELDRVNRSQLNAAGSASRFGKVANQGFMSISKSAATMAAGIAGTLISVKALTDGFQKVLSVGEQYERMQLRAEALIQATGGAAQLSSKQLIQLSEDVALNTLQSVEGVSKAVNVMQTFKSVSGTTFKQAIALSADLATVMGGDITSSAKQLGKALEDPVQGVTALREAGVTFTADQRNVIRALVETGKQAEAQKIILGELEKQVGGVGENEAKGLSGAYDTLAQRFDEFALALNNATGAGENWTEFVNRMARGLNFATKEIKAANEEIDEAEKLFNKAKELQDKIEDLEAAGTKMAAFKVPQLKAEREAILKLLDKELEKRSQLEQQQYDAYQAERQAKEDAAKLAQQAIRDQEEFNASVAEFDKAFERVEEEIRATEAAEAKLRKERKANIKTNGLYVETLEFEYELLQLSDRERYIQINLRKLNAEATEAERQKVRELAGAIYEENAAVESNQKALKESADYADDYAKAWENAIERIDESFADAWKGAFDSFEDFSDSLLKSFENLAAEIAHINITKPLTDQLTGALKGTGGLNLGLSGLFGGSDATNLGKGGQSVVGADAALGQSGLGALQGGFIAAGATLTANAIATVFDDNASNARRRNNLAALTGGLGFLLPSSIFGKPTDSTQITNYDLGTGLTNQNGSLTGDKFSQENRDAADYAALVAYNLADYLQGKTGNQIADSLGIVVGNRDGIRAEINGEEIARGTDAGAVLSTLTDELMRLSGISGEVYKSLSQDGEELYQTLIRVDDQFVVVSAITDKLNLNFGALGDAGLTASDALVLAAGGLESLVAKTDYYYQNFYSEEERLQNIIDSSTSALAEFNESMNTAVSDRDGLRAFVDALDLTTEAGQQAYAAALDLAPSLVDLGTATERLAEITAPTLVAMEDAAENWGDAVVQVTEIISEELQKLTNQANDFAGGIARDALISGMSGYEKDVFLLDEWRQTAVEQLQAFTDQGVEILGGPEKVLSDIEKIYAIRLGEIASKYTQSVVIIDEFIESSDDLSDVLADVIDNTEYLAELEQRRTDAINAVSQAYERESSALENTRDQFSDFAKSLRDFDKSLLTGELSTLNPEQQYREARNQFGDLARRAGLGDTDAIAQLQSSGSSFLQESREFQGSAGSYASDFDFVRQTLSNTISLSDRQASNAEQQLEQMKAQVSEIVSLKEEVKTLKEALAVLVQVEREAGSQMIAQQRQTNATLDGLKSNSDLQATA